MQLESKTSIHSRQTRVFHQLPETATPTPTHQSFYTFDSTTYDLHSFEPTSHTFFLDRPEDFHPKASPLRRVTVRRNGQHDICPRHEEYVTIYLYKLCKEGRLLTMLNRNSTIPRLPPRSHDPHSRRHYPIMYVMPLTTLLTLLPVHLLTQPPNSPPPSILLLLLPLNPKHLLDILLLPKIHPNLQPRPSRPQRHNRHRQHRRQRQTRSQGGLFWAMCKRQWGKFFMQQQCDGVGGTGGRGSGSV